MIGLKFHAYTAYDGVDVFEISVTCFAIAFVPAVTQLVFHAPFG